MLVAVWPFVYVSIKLNHRMPKSRRHICTKFGDPGFNPFYDFCAKRRTYNETYIQTEWETDEAYRNIHSLISFYLLILLFHLSLLVNSLKQRRSCKSASLRTPSQINPFYESYQYKRNSTNMNLCTKRQLEAK